MTLSAKVLTVSESVNDGTRVDRSGEALVKRLRSAGFDVVERAVVPDGIEPVSAALRRLCADFVGLGVSTGGTGFAPSDLTPEATELVLQRRAPALATAMQLSDPKGKLSRGTAGTCGRALVLNLPGSPNGAVQCLDAVLDVVPHALELMAGGHPH
jgi:molybdopterin adenylyltransferase